MSRLTTSLCCLAPATVLFAGGDARAANPTYYDNLAEFQVDVTFTVTDDYANPGYVFNQNDATMSGVLGESDYQATGHPNTNLVTGNQAYCAGCNGSFRLSFTTTSVGDATGVNGVGIDILSHDVNMGYFAFITFADDTTANVPLSGAGTFWGVSAPERIESIHFGLVDGASTTDGYFEIDNLIVGDGFDMTPCGDGIVTDDEQCDDAGASPTCDANCTLATCGDGTTNELAGEECDDAGASPECNADCTLIACGDGIVNEPAGEECDDAGETPTCDIDCTASMCGDAVANIAAGEECDDSAESPACDPDCTTSVCGDGYENNTAGEYCDDGNLADGDGCSATCTNEEIETTSGGESSSEGGETTEGGETETTQAESEGGETTDTPADSSGGVDETGVGTTGGDSVSGSATFDPAETSGGADESGGDSGGSTAGVIEPDSGCGCATRNDGFAWSMLGWLGLGAVARRRRRAVTAAGA